MRPSKGKSNDWTNDEDIGNRPACRVSAGDGCTGTWWRWWGWRRWRGGGWGRRWGRPWGWRRRLQRRRLRRRRLRRRSHGQFRRRQLRRRSHGRLRRKSLRRSSHGGHWPRSLWLWKEPWLLRIRLWLPVLLVLQLAVHLRLLNGELRRQLPNQSSGVPFTGRARVQQNASSPR